MGFVLLELFRMIRALRRDAGFVVLGLLALLLLMGGTIFYTVIEDLRPLDAAYYSVTTLTTVGYGDVTPTTDAGKVFAMVFVLLGVGILLSFVTALATHLRDRSMLHKPLARLAGRDRPPEPGPGLAEPGRLTGEELPGAYDVLVIGSSEASRRTAIEAAGLGLRVVVADRERVLADPVAAATAPLRRPRGVPTLRLDGSSGDRK
jgi:voltage-gated potassium channel